MSRLDSAVSPLPPELAVESERTWGAGSHLPAVPSELRPPESGSVAERLAALHRRHLVRERRALRSTASASKAPVGGFRPARSNRSCRSAVMTGPP